MHKNIPKSQYAPNAKICTNLCYTNPWGGGRGKICKIWISGLHPLSLPIIQHPMMELCEEPKTNREVFCLNFEFRAFGTWPAPTTLSHYWHFGASRAENAENAKNAKNAQSRPNSQWKYRLVMKLIVFKNEDFKNTGYGIYLYSHRIIVYLYT